MSDEEKKELQELINLLYNGHISQYGKRKLEAYIKKQQKEIEELKEDKYELEEEVQIQAKQLIEIDGNYISKKEAEQKERKAYIKGTNDAHELCNKKWEDKIKAKRKECENKKNVPQEMDFKAFYRIEDLKNIEIAVLQSLLKKGNDADVR